MSSALQVPTKETSIIDPRTGTMSRVWLMFFQQIQALLAGFPDYNPRITALEGRATALEARKEWPVGSVFAAVVSTNPNTLLGYGTWVAFGAGRVLTGINTGDADFNVVEKTGGFKTHKHSVDVGDTVSGAPSGVTNITQGAGAAVDMPDATHTHNVDPAAVDTDTVSHLTPYIVVYFWKRTA